ncbi:hypothetical protein C8R42DRAFT_465776 [Lentinula raphanica]|nr:hypothetical protein C8R42DRAFT_465776 [Lentinula raphanica]
MVFFVFCFLFLPRLSSFSVHIPNTIHYSFHGIPILDLLTLTSMCIVVFLVLWGGFSLGMSYIISHSMFSL